MTTTYDNTLPAKQLQEMKQRLAAMQDDFEDADGNALDLGYPVRYIKEPFDTDPETTPWTPERWGVVTGFARDVDSNGKVTIHVQVTSTYVRDQTSEAWPVHDQWYTEAESLRVIQ